MKKIVYLLVAVLITASACRKDEPDTPSFDVKLEQKEYHVNDTVKFALSGNADIISFYSGETGKEYQYRNRTEAEGLKLQLTLGTRVLYGVQTNNLRILCSTDFSGVYSPAGINEEEWTDITDQFTLSPTPAGQITTTTTFSGPIDLTTYVQKNKPIYFAFKYQSQASTTTAQGGRTWRVYNFDLETVAPDGTASLVTNAKDGGWIAVDIENAANKWTIASTAPYLYLAPGSINPSLDWVISRPFQPTSVNPDTGTAIKAYLDKMSDTYSYVFTTPGTYKVTFVARNVNNEGDKEVVKEVEVVVQ